VDEQLPQRARLHGEVVPPPRAEAGVAQLPRRLLASWQRSEDYGVSLESVEPVFAGTYDVESLFFQCGQEVLTDLHKTLADEPISLMLTDAEGLVLNRFSGDHALLRALDAVHLAPGFAYSEREAGTNGLGLALADRVPTVVRAEEHYSLSLCTYTCAAVPVLDPHTGRLEGSVNLTTWARSSSDLLLALAQSAASNTSALMLARSGGLRPRPTPRGEVFRVETPRLEPGTGSVPDLGHAWTAALARAEAALAAGRVVAAVGEPGAGRATLLAQAQRRHRPRGRILAASAPSPADVEPWLSLWLPEVGKPHTAVIVRHVDLLSAWVAERLRELRAGTVGSAGDPDHTDEVPFCVTAERFEDIPAPLASIIDTVVHVPPLRERVEDILPLAQAAARRARGRDIDITSAALHALENHSWPGNVSELHDIARRAALQTDCIDIRHLPAELLSGSNRRLTRIEAFERDEIIRVLTQDDVTMKEAADELGMSRATIYRKLTHFGIQLPRAHS
jgi:sigma-54 dependent transcriptional regulator, acetoin dehydrogenase operon transcriptional activator AcoR